MVNYLYTVGTIFLMIMLVLGHIVGEKMVFWVLQIDNVDYASV